MGLNPNLPHENPTLLTYEAESAVAAYTFVKDGTGGRQVVTCGDGEKPTGVALHQADAGEVVSVQPLTPGTIVPVICGAAIAAVKDNLASDAAGKAVAATTGENIAGTSRTTTAGADEMVSIRLETGDQTEP